MHEAVEEVQVALGNSGWPKERKKRKISKTRLGINIDDYYNKTILLKEARRKIEKELSPPLLGRCL